MDEVHKLIKIQGAGSGKKQKKQVPPKESPNTLQSSTKGQILDLIAYGPIEGLVNGLQSVFLNDTPVENSDGTFNFEGVSMDARWGAPYQDVIPGFKAVSNPREINVEINYDTPVVRTLLNNDADAIIVTVRVPALVKTNTSNGDTLPAEIPFAVHIRDGNGTWNTGVADVIQGKTTSPYERSYRIDLNGTGPYSVRLQRGNKESESQDLRDALGWAYLVEVVDTRHNYPGCALIGVELDAKLFGNSMPSRKYLVDLSIIKVPSNYNPITRTYTGLWDGTFKESWTDNPAWCYYDLATHPLIGAGITEVNKWALYEIAKYCDELVDDGNGGKEPRFTCNTLFSAQEDAITALSTLASVFRGMMYWGGGAIEPVADMPGPVRRILSPSDVLDGAFTYAGTSLKERHSVAVVMWNDPADQYEAKPEMVEDAEQIELLGWRELRLTAVACTSRGQARRVGLWALYSEKMETQSVSFNVPIKHFDMRPGEFFGVNDPYRSGARLGGKVAKVVGNKITLDSVPVEAATGWLITLETSEGGLQQVSVIGITGDQLTVSPSPLPTVIAGAGFALSSSSVVARLFRVVAVSEHEGSTFSVTATEHNPNKYYQVENGLVLPAPPTTLIPTGRLTPPSNLTAETFTYVAGGTEHQGLTIGWTPPVDARVDGFVLDVIGPEELAYRTVYSGAGISFDLEDAKSGYWRFRVRSTSPEWGTSSWLERAIEISSLLQPTAPLALTFSSTTNTITITPTSGRFGDDYEYWRSAVPLPLNLIESNATYLGTGSSFVDMPLRYGTTFYYYVRAFNLYGKSGWVAGQATTTEDVNEILDLILKEEQDSALGQWFKEEVDKISGSAPGSVNERIVEADLRVAQIVSDLESTSQFLSGEIATLQWQLAQFTDAAPYDPLSDYSVGTVIQYAGGLYRAKIDVFDGQHPYDEAAWEKIGDFASVADAVANLATRVDVNETSVSVLRGIVTPMSSSLTSISASLGSLYDDEDGYLEGALRQWDARAEITEERVVRVNSYEALSQRIVTLTSYFGNLSSSLTTLETTVANANTAFATQIISLKADLEGKITSNITIEREARVTATEALAREISQLKVTVDTDITAAILAESVTRASETEALASDITALEASLKLDTSAKISAERTVRVTAEEAIASQLAITTAKANAKNSTFKSSAAPTPPAGGFAVGDLWYGVGNALKRWGGSSWEDADDTRLGTLNSMIVAESTARANAVEAVTLQTNFALSTAQAKNKVTRAGSAPTTASVGDVWYNTSGAYIVPFVWNGSSWETVEDERVTTLGAAVSSEISTRTTQVDALARRTSQTEASVGGLSTSVSSIASSQASTNGKLASLWGIKMQAVTGGKTVVAGIGLGLDNSSGQPVSNFQILAHKFTIINNANGAETVPFAIDAYGKTIIQSALIGDASITMLKIKGGLQSDNWNETTKIGWKLDRNGNFQINAPLPGQGKIEINNKGMRVFDEAGRLRVKIGDLR